MLSQVRSKLLVKILILGDFCSAMHRRINAVALEDGVGIKTLGLERIMEGCAALLLQSVDLGKALLGHEDEGG
jgi:hypothetical protein